MKAEFELTLKGGTPVIKVRHHDKNSSLDQLALKLFIEMAKNHSLKITPVSGYLNSDKNESYEDYIIEPIIL